MQTYTLNDTSPDIGKLQRYLNEHFSLEISVDGHLGKLTQSALQRYQDKFRITERNEEGAMYGPLTQYHAGLVINVKYLNEEDYARAADKAKLDIKVIKAVTQVEALGFGFYNNGLPVTLFERHIFYRQLVNLKGQMYADIVALNNSDICNKSPGGYLGGKLELERLEIAKNINETAALNSASYGLFQIMGFNHIQAGYKTVKEYYDAMRVSEDKQLDAFINYILNDKDKSLWKSLANKDFTAFAKEYNGPAYAKNRYDIKMKEAYSKLG